MSSIPMQFLPAYMQNRADSYPVQAAEAGVLRVGQNTDFLAPWDREAARAPYQGVHARTAFAGGYDPIMRDVAAYGQAAGQFGPAIDASQQLNFSRQSGSRLRSVSLGALVPLRGESEESSPASSAAAPPATQATPWYQNPMYIGAGVLAAGALLYFATR